MNRLSASLATPAFERVLAPFYPDAKRPPRYYQQIAINRANDRVDHNTVDLAGGRGIRDRAVEGRYGWVRDFGGWG